MNLSLDQPSLDKIKCQQTISDEALVMIKHLTILQSDMAKAWKPPKRLKLAENAKSSTNLYVSDCHCFWVQKYILSFGVKKPWRDMIYPAM